MKSNSLSVSLAELEDNLKNIDSVHQQVNNLVDTIRVVNESYKAVLLSVEDSNQSLGRISTGFTDSINQFDKSIIRLESKVQEDVSIFNNTLNQSISEQQEIIAHNKKKWDEYKQYFTDYIQQFGTSLDKESKEIVEQSKRQLEDLNAGYLQQFEILKTSINTKIEELNNLGILARIDEMEHSMSSMQAKVESVELLLNKTYNEVFAVKTYNKDKFIEIQKELSNKAKVNQIITILGFIVVFVALYLIR